MLSELTGKKKKKQAKAREASAVNPKTYNVWTGWNLRIIQFSQLRYEPRKNKWLTVSIII